MNKNIVKIILIATDTKRKSLVFVDENLKVYSLQEAILATRNGIFKNVYTVNRSGNIYLRSMRNTPSSDKLDKISISSFQLFYSLNDLSKILSVPAFKNYWQKYQQNLLQEKQEKEDDYLVVDGQLRITKLRAKSKLLAHKNIIFEAAEKFNIDIYLLAGIIIDEITRFAPFEEVMDLLAGNFIGRNTSGGIAQVTTKTARGLMLLDYYNPDPEKFSSKDKIERALRQQIFSYVKESKHSIFFGAAQIRYFIDRWKKFVDLNKRPEIIATLYSLEDVKPHNDPKPNNRGLQIANEFYKLAEDWLK